MRSIIACVAGIRSSWRNISASCDLPVRIAVGFISADPKVAVAALIEKDDQILLVRRVNDPQRGLWTLPAGFVDAGEDPVQAIVRECLEETGLHVQVLGLLDVLAGQEHARGAHILIVYRVSVLSGTARPGDDADAVAFLPTRPAPRAGLFDDRTNSGKIHLHSHNQTAYFTLKLD